MPTTTEIEARLRGYARQYDQEFPSTARAESRTMARIAITPRPLARVTEPWRKWGLAGVLGLVVGRGGVPLFTTGDGGAHWQRQQIPSQLRSADLIYFLDAREGWIIGYLNEATPGVAGVFHTTDGGQHWTQTARLDVDQVFSYGQRGGSLQGSLIFDDSSTGWLSPLTISGTDIPVIEPHLYITHDSGRSWSVQKLPTQVGISMYSTTSGLSLHLFFNQQDGVLLVSVITSTPKALSAQELYFYSTTDGGDHWSGPRPISIPGGLLYLRSLVLIDPSHWVLLST